MRTSLRPGPQPWRKRLQELDVAQLGEGLQALLTYARGEGDTLGLSARELAEAVVVGHQAAVARSALASGQSVTVRDLAALAGVTPSRVRQLAKQGLLKKDGAHITASSALGWMDERTPRSPIKAHRLRVEPTWWRRRSITRRPPVIRELEANLPAFASREVSFDLYDAILTIPRSAGIDVVTAERISAEVRAWLEAHDPGDPVAPFVPGGSPEKGGSGDGLAPLAAD